MKREKLLSNGSLQPQPDPLKNIQVSEDGYIKAVTHLQNTGWPMDSINKFKSDTIRSLSRFTEHRALVNNLKRRWQLY